MKRPIFKTAAMMLLLTLFISGCSQNTETASSPISRNPLENLSGEAFLLALVDCDDAYISRHYEAYKSHKGVDIAAPEGRKIYAAEDGTVSRTAVMNMGYGNHLIIDHDGYRTLYAHCLELLVNEGDQVKQGDVIALVGNTGNSTGAHLHFEVIDAETKEKINPVDKY